MIYIRIYHTISEQTKDKLKTVYTISDLGKTIKSCKINKASGADDYPNEFLKIFLDELKFMMLRYSTDI